MDRPGTRVFYTLILVFVSSLCYADSGTRSDEMEKNYMSSVKAGELLCEADKMFSERKYDESREV